MWDEFKAFVMRGSVIDLAVGVIIGTAFSGIVSSLVDDVLMPIVGIFLGGLDFSGIVIEVQEATINVGLFINAIINFLIIAAVIFLIVRWVNKLTAQPAEEAVEEPTTKDCPYCKETIAIEATRCPNCTSQLEGSPA